MSGSETPSSSEISSGFPHFMEDWKPTDYEKDLLRRTFSFDFDFLYDLGCNIYFYIFKKNPHVKELFPQLQNCENIHENKAFRAQVWRFSQVISYTVRLIYQTERVAKHLQHVGTLHVKYVDRGFRSEYWNIFQDAMQEALAEQITSSTDLTDQQKVEATEAWRALALFIIVHMKHGFTEELHRTGKQEEK